MTTTTPRRGPAAPPGTDAPAREEAALVAALRRGDEAAFAALLDRYHGTLTRLATLFVAERVAAEAVARETWVALLRELDGDAGGPPLRVRLVRLLLAGARRAGGGPPAIADLRAEARRAEPAVRGARFWPGDHPRSPGRWARAPQPLDAALPGAALAALLAGLPPGQRAVVALRDLAGLPAGEVGNLLGLGEADQRALLHRARSRLRGALECRGARP